FRSTVSKPKADDVRVKWDWLLREVDPGMEEVSITLESVWLLEVLVERNIKDILTKTHNERIGFSLGHEGFVLDIASHRVTDVVLQAVIRTELDMRHDTLEGQDMRLVADKASTLIGDDS